MAICKGYKYTTPRIKKRVGDREQSRIDRYELLSAYLEDLDAGRGAVTGGGTGQSSAQSHQTANIVKCVP